MGAEKSGKIKIGNCGWSYYNPPPGWEEKFRTKLQAYSKVFDLVEINSTFYNIPKVSTATRWREEADETNPKFEFTIKVSQIITHRDKFSTNTSLWAFDKMKEIAKALRAKILLFQSPDSFRPSADNLEKAGRFFSRIKKQGYILVWEVRWNDTWTREIVEKVFSGIGLNQCVDPLRQECYHAKDLAYYRLHGFGSPMYNYDFSEEELNKMAEKAKQSKKPVYFLFNNSNCYGNALKLKELLQRL